jgi:tight adherence protein C
MAFLSVLIPLMVFAAVAAFVWAIATMAFSEERQVVRALRNVSDWESSQAAQAEPLVQPFRARVFAPAMGLVMRSVQGLVPSAARERIQRDLQLAGSPAGLTPDTMTVLSVVLTLVAPVTMGVLLAPLARTHSALYWIVVAAAAVAGFLAPGFAVDVMRKGRQDKIRRALPDMLDMLTISVQAGLGLDTALTKLVQNTEGPLALEFSHMLTEVQAGVSRRDALRHLGERTGVSELNNFIMAMVQAEVFGVSVSGILATQAAELRKKRRQRAEEMGQKAPVKMVFPIMLCMLPATMIVVLGPAIIAVAKALGVGP